MRLFIAINFNNDISERIFKTIQEFRKNTIRGNFTKKENLYLTLVFIGETTQIEDIKQAMNTIAAPSFCMEIGGLGHFSRTGGDIYWIGVKKNEILLSIHKQLSETLNDYGINIDKKPYKPHLTIGREIRMQSNLETALIKPMEPTSFEVNKISLMKSERLDGRLVYTEIYAKNLPTSDK